MAIEKEITITFRNGHQCEHHPLVKSEDKWWEMVAEVMLALNKPRGGILVLNHPFGMHRVDDISAIHFGDMEPPPDIPSIGFHPQSGQEAESL